MGRHFLIKEKECKKCKGVFSREYFGVWENGALDSYCKACRAKKGFRKYKPREKHEPRIKDDLLAGHEALAGAIIKTAISDYQELKSSGRRWGIIEDSPVSIEELEEFFRVESKNYISADIMAML